MRGPLLVAVPRVWVALFAVRGAVTARLAVALASGRETVRSLSVAVPAGNLRGAVLSTRGPGDTSAGCTSCSAKSIAGSYVWDGNKALKASKREAPASD